MKKEKITEYPVTLDMQDAGSIAGYKIKVEKNKIGLFHITASLDDTVMWKSETGSENEIRELLQELKYDPDKLRWYIRNWEGIKMKEYEEELKQLNKTIEKLQFEARLSGSARTRNKLNEQYRIEVAKRDNLVEKISSLPSKKLEAYAEEKPEERSEEVKNLLNSAYKYGDTKTRSNKEIKEEKVLTLKQKLHGAGIRKPQEIKQIEKNVDQYAKLMKSAKSVIEKDGAYIITTKDGSTHRVSGIIGDYAYRRAIGGSSKPQGKELTDDEMNRLYTAAMYVEKYNRHVPKNGARYIHFQKIHGTKCLIGTDKRHMYVSVFDYPDAWDNKGILVEGEENFIDRLKKTEKAYYTDEAIILGEYEFSLEETDNRFSNIERIVPASEDMIHQITIDDEFMTNCRKSLKRYMKDVKFQPVYFLENRTAMFHEYTTVIEKIDTPFKVELSRVIKAWNVVNPETIDVYNGVVVIPGESEFVLIVKMTLVEMDYEEIKSQG